jgi:gamma-glutamyl hercynylcysteine S-oxide synthase
MGLGLFSRNKAETPATAPAQRVEFVPAPPAALPSEPVARARALGRWGLLVNQPQRWAACADYPTARAAAARVLDEAFALVPEGLATLPATIFDQPGQPETDVETAPYLLALTAVTNAQYQGFVDDGGYEELGYWPEDIWPNLINFKDQTGASAPRFWRDGRHDQRLAAHPVVGVCYYEAAAYATWAGYRLPTEAEWQMAASWRIRSAANVARRYPWGDGLDLRCCNIWATGHNATLPVDVCTPGAAPNGVLQLIGNVWEWTNDNLQVTDREGRTVVGETLLKAIRGGAYDTYFPWQATSDFRSGLGCLSRVHNTGFRCALHVPADH